MSLFSALGSVFTGGASNIFKGISGALGGTDPITGINPIQDYTGITTAKMNLKEQKRQFDLQQKYNQQQFDYQKWLNAIQMQREDTSYQRKVADMVKAGFNPILATGGSGEPSSPLKAPALSTGSAPQMSDYSGGIRDLVGTVFSLLSMKKDFLAKDASIALMKSQKADTEASKALKEAEATKAIAESEKVKQETKYGDDYYIARNEGIRLSNESRRLSNELDSRTLEYKVSQASVELDMSKVKLYNSQLDSELKKLGITKAELENEILRIDKQYKGNIYEAELTAKMLLCLKASAEYNTYLWDVSFYHERYNLPYGFNLSQGVFGTTLPQLAAQGEKVWTNVKNFLSGGFSDNVDNLFGSIMDYCRTTATTLSEFAKKVGVSKNELIWSFRRPADGVRRNQYSVMFVR